MTYRSLLAFEVGDVPWLSIAVTGCALLFVRWPCFRSHSSHVHYCNPWIVETVDKITALIIATLSLSLALTRLLQTLSYSDHTLLDTKRSNEN